MPRSALFTSLVAAASVASALVAQPALYFLQIDTESSYAFTVTDGKNQSVVSNIGILAGSKNNSMTAVSKDSDETSVDFGFMTPTIVRVNVNSSLGFTGAQFATAEGALHYGVWAHPFNESIVNSNVVFDLKGMQGNDGINYASVRSPFFVSSAGYAVYTDTQAMGSYSFSSVDNKNEVQFGFNATEIVYYIILPESKGDLKSLLTQYGGLTDRSPLWSPKAYGPMFWHNDFQRKSGFPDGVNSSQEFVEDVVNKLAQHRIRASAVMVDRPYGTGTEGWGNFDFDTEYWPDIRALVKHVAQKGLDFQVWVANRAVPGSQLYNDSESRGWLLETASEEQPGHALNLSNTEAYMYLGANIDWLPNLGIKGYKIDRGEEDEMPVWEQNTQSYLFHKLLYEGQAKQWGSASADNRRPAGFYNFARNANDRSRKYTGVWGGDPASSIDGLLQSIRNGIRSGLLGFPIWGSDCGGYTRKVGRNQPTEKLWARWMWFSAFSPVYEVMLYEGSIPWYDYSDDLVDVLRNTAQLHHELIPFIQSYMYRATVDGLPLIRALFLEASKDDDSVWEADESYFFGEEFLVAPITRDDGEKEVYFPKGQRYLEYLNKQDVYDGGSSQTFTMGIDSVPVFVREGSIIPRGDIYRNNRQWEDNNTSDEWRPWLNIEIYPSYGVKSSKFIYFDEASGRPVEIKMEADKSRKTICVSYGRMSAPGKLVFYVKGGAREFGLSRQGANKCVRNVETLFD
ncbi:glycosyl hydrolases family 31-domain-containing protein [Aspergillus pseudoustus]|uniref:Glycosyl hydrolases family 31-domain-containing protein n=1 Tax=Aspergillus pseudoustus TaxID=1810923 RepID=A0ABR4J1R8_9EURO